MQNRGYTIPADVIARSPLPDWAVDISPDELGSLPGDIESCRLDPAPTQIVNSRGVARPVNRILY